LVGCDTDGVGKTLTKDFARAVYNNIPTLKNADITGRAGEVQVNDDGTKTMKTGGAKTVYSWRDGNIVSETEGAKTTADNLKNPLSLTIFDFISKRIRKLESLTASARTPAENEFYKILSECRDYVDAFDYKDMSAQEKISFFQGIKEKLSNFSDTGTPPPLMQADIATFDNYVVEAISRSEHRIEMNNKFPVTITKGNKIPNIIHYVWTGGSIPKLYLENIKAIKRQNDKLTVRLHYDPDSLLMNELKKRMQTHVNNNLTVGGNRRYEAIKLTKRFSDYCGDHDLSSDAIKGFMVDVLGIPIAEINEIEGKSNKYWGDFPGNNPNLELAPISFDDTELSGMKEAYQFELKNGSMAGASDVVRFSVLHTEGGMYADVGLISDRTAQDNFLHNYVRNFPENGFIWKQEVDSFHHTYPLMANNNLLVAAPHSEFTGTLVQDISEAYNRITSNEVERARRGYGSNQVFDQYNTSIVPLGKFYLDHVNHLSLQSLGKHILDTQGSWQSNWNTRGVEFIVFIADTEKLTPAQREGLVDRIEKNLDGYNNDAYKIVVLDSHAVIDPVRREIIEHMNPFFTIQGLPLKDNKTSIDYPTLFERSRRIVVFDNDAGSGNSNNFEPMLKNFNESVEHKKLSAFDQTLKGVVESRCFQVFLFDDRADFKQTIQELAPDISRKNYVALVYDKSNQKYDALDDYNFEFKDGDRLKVNFIGELNNLDDPAEIQRKISSAENALPQIDIRKHTKETRVVLSKDMRPDQSLFKIQKTFSEGPNFYTNKGTVAIHAQNDEDKSNVTILVNNKIDRVAIQGNETLTWITPEEPQRTSLQRIENSADKSDSDSLNKYHNIVIQSSGSWHTASYHLASHPNFKGKTSIVQVSYNGFRTIYGTPLSLITGDVRVSFAFNDSDDIVNNMIDISKTLDPNVNIKDIRLINRMEPDVLNEPVTRMEYVKEVLRVAHRYKDAQVSMQPDMKTNNYLLRNYSFNLPYIPSYSSVHERNIIFKISNDSGVDKYADRMTMIYPNTSYIATLDPVTNEVRVYDSYGNIVTNANIQGEYEIHVMGRVSDLERIGSKGLSDHIINLQKSIKVKPKKKVSIKFTTCSTQKSAENDLLFDSNSHALDTVRQLKRYNKKVKISDNINVVLDTTREGISTVDTIAVHLAETTPHQDTPLHNWADLSQEQINKLTTEAQKPQPSLANHDHQVLIQTEADGNVRDSTFRLASKHPAQTTIVQMQKDGTHQVVYGLDLEDITGKVKMVAVGYGREKDGTQTMGGRTADELSANITELNRALAGNADIQRISIVGCNMESDNPTDNNDSQYGRRMVEKLSQSNIKAPVAVRSSYVAVDENGRKLTSNTGAGNWMHKDSAAKTVYSLGATGAVVSRVYNDEGTLIKYNGRRLNEDLDNDKSTQGAENQETSDKHAQGQGQGQSESETETTKQKLDDID
ncbi:C80 family cysteine peptidase, partial [Bathymodiolus thermophilus thioautotrophic gill symbiont]